jgi:acetyl-CoA carboxylase carboxyl transferase subunit beta
MSWFKRKEAGIRTTLDEQRDVPEGQWIKCAGCEAILNWREWDENHRVCHKCNHHGRISALDYFELLFDRKQFELHDTDIISSDPLGFTDRKPYAARAAEARKKTGLNDAARRATGMIDGRWVSVVSMDFSFIGGSMGSAVGEIIAGGIRAAIEKPGPLVIISQSGGARMMEGALSLMQLAKTSALLTKLDALGQPYISVLTHPTTGGVTASFAMLGDVHIAEPGALIGFAGPRVVRETMGQDLPKGFQTSEYLRKHGFVDQICDRRNLKTCIARYFRLIQNP